MTKRTNYKLQYTRVKRYAAELCSSSVEEHRRWGSQLRLFLVESRADELRGVDRHKPLTKKALKEKIQNSVRTNNKALFRALRLIYQNQTLVEAAQRMTIHKNSIGFTAFDAELLTQFAIQLIERGFLTEKQCVVLRKKMVKYWKQLIPYARKKELDAKYPSTN